MKKMLLSLIYSFVSLFCLSQNNLIERLKAYDKKNENILYIDRLGNDTYIVTGSDSKHVKTYLITKDEVKLIDQKYDSENLRLNRSSYFLNNGGVYKIRKFHKEGIWNYYLDHLEGSAFVKSKNMVYQTTEYLGHDYFKTANPEFLIIGFDNNRRPPSNGNFTLLNLSNLESPRFIIDSIPFTKDNVKTYNFDILDNDYFLGSIVINEVLGSEVELVLRTFKFDSIAKFDFRLSFENDVREIVSVQWISQLLNIIYYDADYNVCIANFNIEDLTQNNLLESKISLRNIIKDYELDKEIDVNQILSKLKSTRFEVFEISNKDESYYILSSNDNGFTLNLSLPVQPFSLYYSDLIIFKVVNENIVWSTYIARGRRFFYDDLRREERNQSYVFKIENGKLFLDDIETSSCLSDNGNFKKTTFNVGVGLKYYKIQIVINLETGEFTRKIIEKL